LITKSEFLADTTYQILKVITVDGKDYTFDQITWETTVIYRNHKINGLISGQIVSIPIDDVNSVVINKKATTGKICIIGCAGVAAVLGIAIATKESCPFIYSYDGQNYVFDGEPYGGAICEALTRTDFCRLEHLKNGNGRYRIMITNEVHEIQNTDQLSLIIVDHPKEVSVIPDEQGNFYAIEKEQSALKIENNHGSDFKEWMNKKDDFYWTSEVSSKGRNNERLRDTLIFTFKKPLHAKDAKLVLNAGTTLWGSKMLLEMTALRGRSADNWFESLKNPMAYEQLEYWNQREELYRLNVHIYIKDHWEKRGEITGGGPFMIEDRAIPLDLTGVEDTLKIKLSPPVGFWQINYVAMDFTPIEKADYQEVFPSIALYDGKEVTSLLKDVDHRYLTHPLNGDKAIVEFGAPLEKVGMNRTIFAKTTGYYDLIFDKTIEPDAANLSRISYEPGFSVKFSSLKYREWKENLIGMNRP
jgi:hypothetical protein